MSNSKSIKNDKRLNNLKYLAEEMVQILIEQKNINFITYDSLANLKRLYLKKIHKKRN